MPTPSRPRPAARWITTGLLVALGVGVALSADAAPSGPTGRAANQQGAVPLPVVASDNVELLSTLPIPAAISLEFARTGDFAYVSSTTGVYVLDLADREQPKITGVLPTVNFENESMTYGERVNDEGVLERFVILAIDLVEVGAGLDPDGGAPGTANFGGLEIAIIDVTDPTNPFLRSRAAASTSTHTTQCVDKADCDFAYTAGEGSEFSIMDLRDLDAPKELKTVPSPAAGPGGVGFASGAGHYWDFDGVLGWHTGSGGGAAFDVSDPTAPTLVNATDPGGRSPGLNDFIQHNSMRPNAEAFRPGAPPSVQNGNVLLVTEEDYANEGDEVVCERAGSFQTWYVPDLDAEAYGAKNPDGKTQDVGTVTNLDSTNAPAEFGGGLTTPVAGFCSAHWFDAHQDGFVAQGWYGAGLRIMDVRDARNIDQFGYVTTGATEVWDAYWVPLRDAGGVETGDKSNIVYTADAARGVDVFSVALPGTGEAAPEPTASPTPSPTATQGVSGPTPAVTGTGGSTGTTSAVSRSRGSLAATGAPVLLPLAGLLVAAGLGAARARSRRD